MLNLINNILTDRCYRHPHLLFSPGAVGDHKEDQETERVLQESHVTSLQVYSVILYLDPAAVYIVCLLTPEDKHHFAQ